MQVTEKVSDGLKRTLHVVVGAGELGERFASRVDELKNTMQLKGFRPGKVPVAHIRKMYGRSIMAEVLERAVQETSQKAVEERKERLAVQPKIELTENKDEIEKAISGEGDLAYSMSFEVLPEIALADFSTLKIERIVADVDEESLDKAIESIAERNTKYDVEEGRAAADGDQVTIDFTGKIGEEPFPGGAGEDMPVVLGRGGFIPGFEEGLKGAKAGDERKIEATFPVEYPVADLAGKTASFDVKVKSVAAAKKPAIDDELAKSLGAESLPKLRELVKDQIAKEYAQVSRAKLKRVLLDELEKAHTFELPSALVDAEFEGIWKQVTDGLEQAKKSFADEGKTEESAREEYRKIAQRRVRLGLVIGEVGDKGKVEVSKEELRRALVEQARRYPGQEKAVFDFYEKNPGALTELRAPILEEKVIDYIIELAKPGERRVSREELFKQPDAEE